MVDVAQVGAPRQQVKKGGFATKREALAAMADVQSSVSRDAYIAPTKQTVGQYLSEWLAGMRGEYAPGTWDAAKLHIERYIAPRIGTLPLRALTTPVVRALYVELQASGRQRGGAGLSAKTVHNIHRTLSRALNDAVAEHPPRILHNPAARAHKQPSSPVQPTWSAEQLRTFYASVRQDRLFGLWRLAASTGLRRGELAGLRWTDVDLDAGRVAVTQQRAKGRGTVSIGVTKGKRGRSVSLDAETVGSLRAHRKAQAAERLAWPGEWGNSDDLVFTHADGAPLHPDSITKTFRRRVAAADLPWIKLHGLRHTHATLMLEAGVNVKVVQERLGHSSIAITGDVYSHVTPGMQEEAAARVAAIVDV
jgi:integrase